MAKPSKDDTNRLASSCGPNPFSWRLGPEHPEVGIALNTLALILGKLGDFAAARPLAERALALAETAYGPEHPAVGTLLDNLARVLCDLGDAAAARPLAERALAIAETASGPRDVAGGVDEGP